MITNRRGRSFKGHGRNCRHDFSIAGSGLIVRFVGRLDQIVEGISDRIVEAGVARIKVFIGDVVGRGCLLDRLGFVEFLNFRQEIRRLVELNRVALTIEKAFEERLLRSNQSGDAGFDAVFRHEVIDVDGQFLADSVNPADSLFEHCGIPWELDVDDAIGSVLEVEPDRAGITGEEDAKARIIVKFDDVLRSPALAFRAGEKAASKAAIAEQVAHCPLGECEHSPPLAEDDDFATLIKHKLPDELAQLAQLGCGEALKRALVGTPVADCRPKALELKLGHPIGYDSLGAEQAHQFEKLGLSERPFERSLDKLGDRLDEVVMRGLLHFGHLDGNARVGSRWKLIEHILTNAAAHALFEPVANGVEVAGADDLATAVGADGVQGAQAPFRFQGHVVDPLDDRSQFVDAVFHRRSGEHQAILWRQAFDRKGCLGRPVFDPLCLVKHNQFGVPAPDGLHVAQELLVVDDEKPSATAGVSGLPVLGRTVDDVYGQIRERRPLASPLRFETGRAR